jgi:hypothetical protein
VIVAIVAGWYLSARSVDGTASSVTATVLLVAALGILLGALLVGVRRLARSGLRVKQRWAALAQSTTVFTMPFASVPKSTWQWFLMLAFGTQLLAFGGGILAAYLGPKDLGNALLVIGGPSAVICALKVMKAQPRAIITNHCFRVVWWLCWAAVVLLGAVSTYFLWVLIDQEVHDTGVKEIGVAIVVMLFLILNRLGAHAGAVKRES